MTIQDRIDDARLLFKAGRYPGAMAMMCTAVAGAARTAFPQGTRSIDNPKNDMGDAESFQRYISPRIAHFIFSTPWPRSAKECGLRIKFRTEYYDFSYILYKWYRCELIHEARLPEDVRLSDARPNPGRFSITLSTGPYLEINADFIESMAAAALLDPSIGIAPQVSRVVLTRKTDKSEYEWQKELRRAMPMLTGATVDPIEAFYLAKPQDWHDSASDQQVLEGFSEFIRSGRYERMEDFRHAGMFINPETFVLFGAGLMVYKSLRDHFGVESKLVDP